MVGPGFVVDVQYFKELGTYDDQMSIWGGENLELPWRVIYRTVQYFITAGSEGGRESDEISRQKISSPCASHLSKQRLGTIDLTCDLLQYVITILLATCICLSKIFATSLLVCEYFE